MPISRRTRQFKSNRTLTSNGSASQDSIALFGSLFGLIAFVGVWKAKTCNIIPQARFQIERANSQDRVDHKRTMQLRLEGSRRSAEKDSLESPADQVTSTVRFKRIYPPRNFPVVFPSSFLDFLNVSNVSKCQACSAPHEKQKARLQYTSSLQTVHATRRKVKL